MRIVHLANFYGPRSGGLRTTMHELGRRYLAAGHDPVLVVPGAVDAEEDTPYGRRITVKAPVVPGTGGYRVIRSVGTAQRLLERLEPDRIEVSDRLTLHGLGHWARRRGVPSVLFAHEHLGGLLHAFLPPVLPRRWAADRRNATAAASYDHIVCTTAFAAEEFERLGIANLVRVPLGVDLDGFSPDRHDPALRARYAGDDDALIVHCGRLSPEKRVDRSIDAVAELAAGGLAVRLVVAGTGASHGPLTRRARGLPVTFLGFVTRRDDLARLLATADVTIAPGPLETFCLSALESLASGTPVVVSRSGALREIVSGGAGVAVADDATAFAEGVRRVLNCDPVRRRQLARARAEDFPWSATVTRMLDLHRALGRTRSLPYSRPGRR